MNAKSSSIRIAGRMRSRLVLFCATLCLFSYEAIADISNDKRESTAAQLEKNLSRFIPDMLNAEDVESISIAVVDRQGVLWAKGFGYADKEKKYSATTKTLYRTGSITMLVTATAVMKLVSEGKISLDKTVGDYLPGFDVKRREGFKDAITIRHLLSHHSGLPVSIFKGMWVENPATLSQLVDAISQESLAHNPGEFFSYSNLNYDLLGFIVEKVSGMPFEQYVAQSLFQPLHMLDSKIASSIAPSKLLAQGYRKNKLESQLAIRDYPALGLYSSVEDIAKLMTMLLNQGEYNHQTVLKLATVHSLLRAQNEGVPLDFDKRVGFGWQFGGIDLQGVESVAWRQGATLLFRSRVAVLPKEGLGVVVFSNSANAYKSVEKITKQALSVALEAAYGIKQEKKDVITSVIPPVPGVADGFESAYSTYVGYVPVKKDLKDYRIQLMGWAFRLKPTSNGWYSVHYDLLGVIPLDLEWIAKVLIAPAEVAGRKLVIAHYEGQNILFGSALASANVPEVWRKKVGAYQVINSDAFLKNLKIEKGRLVLQDNRLLFEYQLPLWFPLTASIPVKPLSDSEAIIPGYGSALGESVYVIQRDGKDVLKYSGYELKRIGD